MLVYDYVELNEDLFKHIVGDKIPYKVDSNYGWIKRYYSVFGQTIIQIYTSDTNRYQYFINSAHPV